MKTKTLLLPFAILLILGLGAITAFLLRPGNPPALKPFPVPNGYLAFLAAGKAMSESSDPMPSLKDATPEQLRTFLGANQAPLKSLRTALSLESAVPWIPTEAYANAHMDEVGLIKKAGLLLVMDGILQARDDHSEDARRSLFDALKYSHLASSQGLVIDRLVAESVAQAALRQFRRLLPKLPAEGRRTLLRDVLAWEALDEAPGVTVERERQVMNDMLSGSTRVGFRIAETVTRFRGGKTVSEASEEGILRGIARRRLVITQLALAAFETDAKRPLARLEELLPQYLPALPVDPFSGNPLVYRRTAEKTLLYSFGPDRKDDGGRPMRASGAAAGQTGGDILADEAF